MIDEILAFFSQDRLLQFVGSTSLLTALASLMASLLGAYISWRLPQ